MLRRSIIVPTYQESGRIEKTVHRLAVSPLNNAETEFLFVDDGSTDRTVEVLEAALRGTDLLGKVLTLPGNRGKGAAIRAGVLAARAEVIAFVDADLSSPPSAILQCLAAVDAGADVAIASRGHATSDIVVRQPAPRELAGKTFNLLVRLLGLTDIPDTQCGLKAFRRQAALALFRPLTIRRFAFDVEVLARARQLGLDVEVIPTEWAHVEESRVSPVRDGTRMAWDAVRVAWVLRQGQSPASAIALRPRRSAGSSEAVGSRAEWSEAVHRQPAGPRGGARLVLRKLAAAEGHAGGRCLDVGSWTGPLLRAPAMGGSATAASWRASPAADGEPPADAHVVRGSTEALPLANRSIDLLTSSELPYHLGADMVVLAEYHRVLRRGGRLVLAVPARRGAWVGRKDERVHRPRYSRLQVEEAVAAAGFRDMRVRWLPPVALALPLRRTERSLVVVARKDSCDG